MWFAALTFDLFRSSTCLTYTPSITLMSPARTESITMSVSHSNNNSNNTSLPKHPTNKKPYPHSPAGTIVTPEGDLISLTYDALDVQKATKEVASRWAGAVVFFLGMTRDDRTQEETGATLRVSRLEYEAYTPLALKSLHSIVHRARTTPSQAWPPADLTTADLSKMDAELGSALSNISLQGNSRSATIGSNSKRSKKAKDDDAASITDSQQQPPSPDSIIKVALINRLGPVEVGEASILVAVSSPHRRRAFEVAEWLLEETKRKVPIWKREVRVRADQKSDKAKEVDDAGRGWVGLEGPHTGKALTGDAAAQKAEEGGTQIAMAA